MNNLYNTLTIKVTILSLSLTKSSFFDIIIEVYL